MFVGRTGGTEPFRASGDGDPAGGNLGARADRFCTGSRDLSTAERSHTKVKSKLSLCLLKHHGTKTYGGDEV
jgi:hypothetical protein